jgi:hypothetical protein
MRVFLSFIAILLFSHAYAQPQKNAADGEGFIKIVFRNIINGNPVVLNDSAYTNPFGEQYTIRKLKYYISNLKLDTDYKKTLNIRKYWLINQANDSSLSFIISVAAKNYFSIGFLLGVDSARNNSGAQTGALDPLNDMFWTWHSGYIMEKLEGTSPQSNIVNNKFEYHIGGYEGDNNVLNYVWLPQQLLIKKGKTSTIIINVDINKFWDAAYQLKISEAPVCSTQGALAKQVAGNFSRLFSIADVINSN